MYSILRLTTGSPVTLTIKKELEKQRHEVKPFKDNVTEVQVIKRETVTDKTTIRVTLLKRKV